MALPFPHGTGPGQIGHNSNIDTNDTPGSTGGRFIGYGEEGTSAIANRAHWALSANCGYLYEKLSKTVSIPSGVSFTSTGQSSYHLSDDIFCGDSSYPGTPGVYDADYARGMLLLFAVLDENLHELTDANGNEVRVAVVRDTTNSVDMYKGGTSPPPGYDGFVSAPWVTFRTVNPKTGAEVQNPYTIPNNTKVTILLGSKSTLENIPTDVFTRYKVNAVEEIPAGVLLQDGSRKMLGSFDMNDHNLLNVADMSMSGDINMQGNDILDAGTIDTKSVVAVATGSSSGVSATGGPTNGTGVVGTGGGGSANGVVGIPTGSGTGVYGNAMSASGDGVVGQANSGKGVVGTSVSNIGVDGSSTSGTGVKGTGNPGVYGVGSAASGDVRGVVGVGLRGGAGVYAKGGATGKGVYAEGGSTSGIGVHAVGGPGSAAIKADAGTGTSAIDAQGSESGFGVYAIGGSTGGGVYAIGKGGAHGVEGLAESGLSAAGVKGSGNIGVIAEGTNYGVKAQAAIGVYSKTTSSSGIGVFGDGQSVTNSVGVHGLGTLRGVRGYSDSGVGVEGNGFAFDTDKTLYIPFAITEGLPLASAAWELRWPSDFPYWYISTMPARNLLFGTRLPAGAKITSVNVYWYQTNQQMAASLSCYYVRYKPSDNVAATLIGGPLNCSKSSWGWETLTISSGSYRVNYTNSGGDVVFVTITSASHMSANAATYIGSIVLVCNSSAPSMYHAGRDAT